MSNRRSSPVFVGREDQLATLTRALREAAQGGSQAIFVGGEAGIGKSRLAEELAAHARANGARVLVGGCLELGGEGLPYAPFVAALRGLVREEGREAVTAHVPAGPVGRLLPDLAAPAIEEAEEDNTRGRLYEHVLLLLERLGDTQPLCLLVEDAHWADRSTRELLVFLVHNLGASRVLLLVTFRSDELHRRHPLRPLLSELDRVRSVTRLELPRFDRHEVAEQAAAILGEEAEPALVEDTHLRTEGNPLFVEALLDCPAPGACGISDSLRDLLLRGVEGLPDETRELLRLASTSGVRVTHAELAAVSGLDDANLAEALRPAVDSSVLLTEGDGYAFRHALLREAVHDELLPGEHARMHRLFAELLEGATSPLPGIRRLVETAHHWHAAHDMERALPAAWRAAKEAARGYAHAERLALLERVLELWEQLPRGEELTGVQHVDVLEHATEAAEKSGELARGVSYASAALGEIDREAEPSRAAALLQARGRMHRHLGRGGSLDDFREAVHLTSADRAGTARAKALGRLAQTLMTELLDDEAAELAEEALELARATHDVPKEVHNLNTLAVIYSHRGDLDGARERFAEARRLADRAPGYGQHLRLAINESDALEAFGQHEKALAVARDGVTAAEKASVQRTQGAFLANNITDSLISLGRWAEAEETIAGALSLDPPPATAAHLVRSRAEVALLRGDTDAASRFVTHARALNVDSSYNAQLQPLSRLNADIAVVRRRTEDGLAYVDSTLAEEPGPRIGWRHLWPLLVVGARAATDALEEATHLHDADMRERVEKRLATLDARAEKLPHIGPVDAAHRATFAAERARAGKPDPQAWRRTAAAWEELRQPHQQAYALFRTAEALVSDGEPGDAAGPLREAHQLASDLPAATLVADIEALGRRARISLGPGDGATSTPSLDSGGEHSETATAVATADGASALQRLGVTGREAEVLDLLAAGRSNRQIASELFISPKTASVHVSNLLAKLGASSRVEAAAAAYRLGLIRPPPGSPPPDRGLRPPD